jgi:rhodanese-related sulfurtransferase
VFAGGFPAWMKAKGTYAAVSVDFVALKVEKNEALVIDSRPKKAKYDKGHIPSAISIPDSQFEALKGRLPADKNETLIFYCGGFT